MHLSEVKGHIKRSPTAINSNSYLLQQNPENDIASTYGKSSILSVILQILRITTDSSEKNSAEPDSVGAA